MFGALLVVIALLWLKQYDQWNSHLGKLILIASGGLLAWHERYWKRSTLGAAWKSMTSREKAIYLLICLVAVAGWTLGRPGFSEGFHLGKSLHWITGALALFYGGYYLVGRDKPKCDVDADVDADADGDDGDGQNIRQE